MNLKGTVNRVFKTSDFMEFNGRTVRANEGVFSFMKNTFLQDSATKEGRMELNEMGKKVLDSMYGNNKVSPSELGEKLKSIIGDKSLLDEVNVGDLQSQLFTMRKDANGFVDDIIRKQKHYSSMSDDIEKAAVTGKFMDKAKAVSNLQTARDFFLAADQGGDAWMAAKRIGLGAAGVTAVGDAIGLASGERSLLSENGRGNLPIVPFI